MKFNTALCLILAFLANLMGQDRVQAEISSATADSRVESRMEAAKSRAASLEANTLAEPASREAVTDLGDRKLILRKIAPMPVPQAPAVVKADAEQEVFSPEFFQKLQAAQVLEPVQLRLSAMVYDSDYTELTLSLEAERYTVWTNLDYSYLPFLGDFLTDARHYTYTGFNYRINREKEREQVAAAQKLGFKFPSQWKESPVQFTSLEPEYILVTEDARAVPPEIYRQLDDLMGYYLEHFDSLNRDSTTALRLPRISTRLTRDSHSDFGTTCVRCFQPFV